MGETERPLQTDCIFKMGGAYFLWRVGSLFGRGLIFRILWHGTFIIHKYDLPQSLSFPLYHSPHYHAKLQKNNNNSPHYLG